MVVVLGGGGGGVVEQNWTMQCIRLGVRLTPETLAKKAFV